ncbi:hypothetical protein ACFLZ7_01250 [Nanoarchaeota archaeon]
MYVKKCLVSSLAGILALGSSNIVTNAIAQDDGIVLLDESEGEVIPELESDAEDIDEIEEIEDVEFIEIDEDPTLTHTPQPTNTPIPTNTVTQTPTPQPTATVTQTPTATTVPYVPPKTQFLRDRIIEDGKVFDTGIKIKAQFDGDDSRKNYVRSSDGKWYKCSELKEDVGPIDLSPVKNADTLVKLEDVFKRNELRKNLPPSLPNSYFEFLAGARYSPSSQRTRSIKDTSPTMVIDNLEELDLDNFVGRGRIAAGGYTGAFMLGLALEDILRIQNGTFTNDFESLLSSGGTEEGKKEEINNLSKVLLELGNHKRSLGGGLGFVYLLDQEGREYKQTVGKYEYKIETDRQLHAKGILARIFARYDNTWIFKVQLEYDGLMGKEIFDSEHEDKTFPGDVKYRRDRDAFLHMVSTYLGAAKRLEKGSFDEIGLELNMNFIRKKIEQTGSNEKFFTDIYEDYRDQRIIYDVNLFARIMNFLKIDLGIEHERRRSKGTIEIPKDNETRVYLGANIATSPLLGVK